ncbi:DUF1361 domain-containing protein [Leptolyngbya sp. FACHB-16]|nr:DUF1361 domain-containing protein [Leptolyngbya sp. FACHB-8]MBD2154076.1 DUF1361 domain-containing protein [Leptolyngbya sp. FACHB-16]
MRSRLIDVLAAFNNVYSGWIWWNLFLAFIPLVLSFLLFRRKAIAQPWLWGFCGIVGFIGAIGFFPRYRHIVRAVGNVTQSVLAGEFSAQVTVFWLFSLCIIASMLSIWLYKRQRSFRTFLWWMGLVAFIAFLPNAPYLLTDVIHLIRGTSSGQIPVWVIAIVFIPLHATAILLGFEAYVISLLNQGYYLKQRGAERWIVPAELIMHSMSAIGIFLGRFIRLNSWDLVVDPGSVLVVAVNTLTARRPVAVIIVTFGILTVLYWIMKQITLGLRLRIRYARKGIHVLE